MNEAGRFFTDGDAYERLMGRWSRLAGEGFLNWLGAPKALRWLDVGCGNGAFTEELVARCAPAAVTAIDPSDDQLAYARTRPGAKMVQFQVGDAQALPFADSSFDVAVMALVITFLSDPGRAAAELARVVRPDGWVATYMWDIPGGGLPHNPVYVALDSLGLAREKAPNNAVSRLGAMHAIWEQAGLQSIDTHVIRIPVYFSSFDDFWESNSLPVGPSGKTIQKMPQGAKEQLKARLREQMPTASDGSITYEAFANSVRGRVPQR